MALRSVPDPAFSQCGFGSRKPDQCGSGSWSDLKVTKSFYIKNLGIKVVTGRKHTNEDTKDLLKGRKPGLFVNFGRPLFSWIWIRNRIPCTVRIRIQDSHIYADPDPQHLLSICSNFTCWYVRFRRLRRPRRKTIFTWASRHFSESRIRPWTPRLQQQLQQQQQQRRWEARRWRSGPPTAVIPPPPPPPETWKTPLR